MNRLLAALLLSAVFAYPVQGQVDLSLLAERSLGSVVLLKTFSSTNSQVGSGSGFFVSPDQVVSNHHVVAGAHRVVAVLADGSEVEITGVLALDELNDLVVLKSSVANSLALRVSESVQVSVGESIVVLGSPAGLAGTVTDGIVSAIRSEGLTEHTRPGDATPPVFQISAPISPGSSGSPVLNLKGEVVGVAVSQLRYGQNLNFAIPAGPLLQVIRTSGNGHLEITYGGLTSVSNRDYLRNVLISLLFFAFLFVVYRRTIGPTRAW